MKKTYEYRAYPTVKQANKLVAWLEILRNLYNQALAWRKQTYEQTGQSVKKSTQEKALTPFRQESNTVASLHIDVLQERNSIRPIGRTNKTHPLGRGN